MGGGVEVVGTIILSVLFQIFSMQVTLTMSTFNVNTELYI